MQKTIHVARAVNEAYIIVGRRLGCNEVIFGGLVGCKQTIVNHAVFLRRENVRTDWQEVIVAINQAKRKRHEERRMAQNYYLPRFFGLGASCICPLTLARTF